MPELPHDCTTPQARARHDGDIWRCPECSRLWRCEPQFRINDRHRPAPRGARRLPNGNSITLYWTWKRVWWPFSIRYRGKEAMR